MRAMKLRGGLRKSPEMRTIGLVWLPTTRRRTLTANGFHAGGAWIATRLWKGGTFDR